VNITVPCSAVYYDLKIFFYKTRKFVLLLKMVVAAEEVLLPSLRL
jgi:hypothetical protein